MKKFKLAVWLALALVIAILPVSPAQDKFSGAADRQKAGAASRPTKDKDSSADKFGEVRAWLRKQVIEQQAASVAVAVACDGQVLWEEGFGWADRESRVPASEHTMYSLASISKPITATGLMALKQQGKIDLDRPINDYLGEAKVKARLGDARDATVRRVANHSSGLPLHYQFFYEDEPHRPPSMDESILRYGNLVTPPGEIYEYSNFGYGILGHVLARLSGKSYAEFMRTEVFLPLGLTRTCVNIGPGMEKLHAVRYGPDGQPIPFYDFDHPGASAVYASAHDLVRFGMFHLKAHLPDQKAILTDAAIDEMQQPTITFGNNNGYGIGWQTQQRKSGHRAVLHSGGMGGVATILYLIPSEKIAVVALANSRTAIPFQAAERIVAALLGESVPAPSAQNQGEPPAFKPPSQLVETWEGAAHTHKGETPLTLQIQESGDIHARLGRQLWTLLNMVSFNNDTLEGRMMGDIGTEDASRRPHVLRLRLKLRGDALNGAVTAMSTPGNRAGNALSYWAELKKK